MIELPRLLLQASVVIISWAVIGNSWGDREEVIMRIKNSEPYLTAKSLLTTGEFESALTTLSTVMATTLSLLPESEETHPCNSPTTTVTP